MERKRKRDLSPRYTIGVVSAHFNNIKGAPTIGYYYYVYGRKYSAKNSWAGDTWDMPDIGSRYYVKFESSSATNSVLLLDSASVAERVTAPDSGWLQFPSAPK